MAVSARCKSHSHQRVLESRGVRLPTRATAQASTSGSSPVRNKGEVLIDFQNVYKSFGSKSVLKGASFQIRRGEAVGIIGGSGTGKSTTLRLIAGLLQPDQGTVFLKGKQRVGLISDGDESAYGLKLGLVFQNAALFDSLSVMENVGFQLLEHSSLSRKEIVRTVTENLARVGLHNVNDLSPAQLSGGMRKRVALARVRTSLARLNSCLCAQDTKLLSVANVNTFVLHPTPTCLQTCASLHGHHHHHHRAHTSCPLDSIRAGNHRRDGQRQREADNV